MNFTYSYRAFLITSLLFGIVFLFLYSLKLSNAEEAFIPEHPIEYLEEELNKLMSEKQNNEEQAKQEFEKRVRETKQKAIAENVKLAKETGNKLTQGITEEGELIGVNEMNTQERVFNNQEEISSGDIRKELFEGDNVRMDRPGQKSAQETQQETQQETVQVEVKETDPTPTED